VSAATPQEFFRRRAAWRPLEFAFWLAAFLSLAVFPSRLL
jgi:hypothetical protein